VVAAPAYAAGAFIREREWRTFDLLVSVGLSRFEWVLGKGAAAFARTLAGVAALLPAWAAAMALGGVSGAEFAYHGIFLASFAAAAVALGVLQSMLLRSYVLALLVTYLLLAFAFLVSVMATLTLYFFHMAVGLPYPGFWLISAGLNGALSLIVLPFSMLLFGLF